MRLSSSADDGLPHRWDCDTTDVLYGGVIDSAIRAGPDVPAIPRIGGKSLHLPKFWAMLLLLKLRGFQGFRACRPLGGND